MSLLKYHQPLPKNLQDQQAAAKIQTIAADFSRKHEVEGSIELLRYIVEQGKNEALTRPSLQKAIARLQLTALPSIREADFYKFFETNVIGFLPEPDIDVFMQIRTRMIATWPTNRDEKKEEIRRSLEKNKETIGKEALPAVQGGSPMAPTGGNWIRAYRQQVGAGEHNNIERSRFLFSHPVASKLPIPDRDLLADFLYLYDLLKVPTGTIGAIDMIDISPWIAIQEGPIEETFDEVEERRKKERMRRQQRGQVTAAPEAIEAEVAANKPVQPTTTPASRPMIKPLTAPQPVLKPIAVPRTPTGPKLIPLKKPLPPVAQAQAQAQAPKPVQTPAQPPRPMDAAARTASLATGKPLQAALPPKPKPLLQPEPSKPPVISPPTAIAIPFQGLKTIQDISMLNLAALRATPEGSANALKQAAVQARKLLAASPKDIAKARELWKATDAYKLYVEIGSASIGSSKNAAQMMEERSQLKQPTLTPEEFEAVAELGRAFSA